MIRSVRHILMVFVGTRLRMHDIEAGAAIGPAFDGFAPVSGTLPMDLEPASFLLAQIAQKTEKASK